MLSESVAQKPIMPVSAGKKNVQNWPAFGWPGIKGGRLRENRSEAAGVLIGPPEQQQAERDEQRRFDVEQPADAIDALVDDAHVDAPEKQEADELRQRDSRTRRLRRALATGQKTRQDFVDGAAADPGLDAEPAARDKRPQQRRNVRAERAEGGPAINGERDSVMRARRGRSEPSG